MIEIKSRWKSLTGRNRWAARRASFLAKARATKAVWFPPRSVDHAPSPASTAKTTTAATQRTAKKTTKGTTTGTTRKRTQGTAKKATKAPTRKAAGAPKKTTDGSEL